MKAFQPYLNFDGKTKDAMTFYQKALGGNLEIQTNQDVGAPGTPDRVIHARLTSGNAVLMASDSQEGVPLNQGNDVWINVDCDSVEEIERIFPAMAEGGKILMPLADQFWGARFGMLADKFGKNWMFNCELKKG
jgi:PhnB protein